MQDSILFWNAVALEANRISHSDPAKGEQMGPTLSSRALAIVHLAMYDAYAGISALQRYVIPGPTPPPSTATPTPVPRDAVAGAAFTTLSALYPAQRGAFQDALSGFNRTMPGAAVPAFDFGVAVGQAMLTLRAGDMDARSCGYNPSKERGRHRPDPDNPGQGFNAPFYGAQTKTFAVSERHSLAAPPSATVPNPKYLLALRDVRARGIRPDLTGTLPNNLLGRRRSGQDTLLGIYWGYDGANRLGTPPRLYNQIIRQVAQEKKNTEAENARLFAFVNAAMGDAGILAWQHKYCYDYWRPVVGIREHDETLGPLAPIMGLTVAFNDGDPGWLPLGGPSTNAPPGTKNFTPNFPAYPSGHATFGAAAFHITRMFYGILPSNKSNDGLFPKEFVSDEFDGGNRDNFGTVRPRHARRFPGGLWQMIMENAISRVFLGVHWIFDAFDFTDGGNGQLVPDLGNENIGGVGLGLRIARDVYASGGNGVAPKMTPLGKVPPIATPASAPTPLLPKQPAAVGGCADNMPQIGTPPPPPPT
jgi:vanadium chloroperoxidase